MVKKWHIVNTCIGSFDLYMKNAMLFLNSGKWPFRPIHKYINTWIMQCSKFIHQWKMNVGGIFFLSCEFRVLCFINFKEENSQNSQTLLDIIIHEFHAASHLLCESRLLFSKAPGYFNLERLGTFISERFHSENPHPAPLG